MVSEKYIVNRYIIIGKRLQILGEIGTKNGTCITSQVVDTQSVTSDYFPMQQDMNFPKLFLHTTTIIDYQ